MKKNKRKGSQESSCSDLTPSPTVSPPPLEWEDRSQCLGPILRYNSLPVVVTCDRSCLPPMEHVNFDFSQPLLLHARRRVRKVVASNVVHVQHDSDALKEVGDYLLIPEDYKGWFAVLGPPDEAKSEKVVPHFRQVAQLALSKCESFLIGGNEPVKAMQMPTPSADPGSRAHVRLVYPGDVLRMGKLYVGESTVKVKKSKLFGGKKTMKKEEKFLLCTDDNDRELYLPVESRGTFYVLTTEGNGTPRIPILRLKDICVHYRFPCVVKLLFGCVPSTPCSFTGTLILRDSQIESSVIGCTMLNLRNILLDLPIDSDLKFFMARSTLELLSSRAYKNARALCQEKASTYMRNMKVAYYLNNEEDSFPSEYQEVRDADGSEYLTSSEYTDNLSRISRPRPSIVEDQELFCPPETTPKTPDNCPPTPGYKKYKKSLSNSETNPSEDFAAISSQSRAVLRKDKTFSLPEPAESLPLTTSKSLPSLNIEARPLPPIVPHAQPAEDTSRDDHYMSMEENLDEQAVPKASKPSPLESRTPPPTPPKPRKNKPISHNRSDGSLYMQIWNGEPRVTQAAESDCEKVDDKPSTPVLRPKRLDLPQKVHRVSSMALADTYLTLPVLKGDASFSTPEDDVVSPSESSEPSNKTAYINTGSVSHDRSDQKEEPIYKVPTSSLVLKDQPYEVMASTSETKYENIGQEQKPPTPPPKTRQHSSNSLFSEASSPQSKPSPCVPGAGSKSPDIVFENPSWMFSDTSSQQSCEYASRWLSSHQASSPKGPSDPTYVHMHRESYTYYEGYEANKKPLPAKKDSAVSTPETETKTVSLDQSLEQSEMELTSSAGESEIVYENLQNLRPCKETLSVSSSVSGISEENHGHFLDRIANPPTTFGYVRAPAPRPVTPKKKPPVPKKPSFDRVGDRDGVFDARPSFQSSGVGGNETRHPLAPKPCRPGESTPFGYLHPCRPGVQVVQGCQDFDVAAAHRQTCAKSSYSDISQRSFEDDLPLGATFANFRSRVSDSGAPESVVEERGGRGDSGTSFLSVADLADALKDVGLTKDTVDILRQEKVDGRLLASLDEEELKEILPGIKKLDIKKIQMFVNMGWRPRE